MKKYLTERYRIFGLFGVIGAFIIATFYLIVVPEEAAKVNGIAKIVLVYGHSLCWILLSIASLLWMLKSKNKWSKFLAYTALVTYIIFIGALFLSKST